MIPCPEPTIKGEFEVFFFSRGLRHLKTEDQQRASKLRSGERLYLLQDFQNAYDEMALLLRTDDPVSVVGYVPRYYSRDFSRLIEMAGRETVMVSVARMSTGAPIQYRVLCKLSAPWPADFSPCQDDSFLPVQRMNPESTRATNRRANIARKVC